MTTPCGRIRTNPILVLRILPVHESHLKTVKAYRGLRQPEEKQDASRHTASD